MTRDGSGPVPGPEPDPGAEQGRRTPDGALRPTPLLTVAGWSALGAVLGWAVHPICDRLGLVPPLVSATQPLALLLLAAILAYVAWVTHRAVHVRADRLEAHQGLNRLVLARASALVAALVAGGYLGYALSWIGDPAELADERLVRSLIAAGCGALAALAAILLERACRVRGDGPEAR